MNYIKQKTSFFYQEGLLFLQKAKEQWLPSKSKTSSVAEQIFENSSIGKDLSIEKKKYIARIIKKELGIKTSLQNLSQQQISKIQAQVDKTVCSHKFPLKVDLKSCLDPKWKYKKELEKVICGYLLSAEKNAAQFTYDIFRHPSIAKAIFFSRNDHFLKEGRQYFHNLYEHIWDLAVAEQANSFGNGKQLHIQAAIGQLLALYAHFCPQDQELVSLPQLVVDDLGQKEWVFVEYKIERLELTDQKLGSPICAFGFVPQQIKGGNSSLIDRVQPLLLFKGTTYPTDDGFWVSLMADTKPRSSVGTLIFCDKGRSVVLDWLKKNTKDKTGKERVVKPKLIGMSLGGALEKKFASDEECRLYFSDGLLYGPPGVSKKEKKQIETSGASYPYSPQFCNDGDLVPLLEDTPIHEAFPYYKVLGNAAINYSPTIHAKCLLIQPNSTILRIDSKYEANRFLRKVNTIFKRTIVYPVYAALYIPWTIMTTQRAIKTKISKWRGRTRGKTRLP